VTRDDLIARLGQLEAGDRGWLLGELPPAMRRELAQLLADETPADAQPAKVSMPAARDAGWESLGAERVADVLRAEPVWLVSAALRAAEPQWRERVLAATPARRRHEIEMADRTGRPLGTRAAQILFEGCRDRIAGTPPAAPARAGFAALVDQMRSRFA
jgi:hypothetical protein